MGMCFWKSVSTFHRWSYSRFCGSESTKTDEFHRVLTSFCHELSPFLHKGTNQAILNGTEAGIDLSNHISPEQ